MAVVNWESKRDKQNEATRTNNIQVSLHTYGEKKAGLDVIQSHVFIGISLILPCMIA